MIIGKSHIRQIVLEQINKDSKDQKIQSVINSFASELKNLSQELKNDAVSSNIDSTKDVKEGAAIVGISIAAALPKILELASEYALKFNAVKISTGLDMWAEELHHLYIGAIISILNLVPAYRKAPQDLKKAIADTIFISIVIVLTGASLQAVIAAVSKLSLNLLVGAEILLLKIKTGEIKEFLSKEFTTQLQIA